MKEKIFIKNRKGLKLAAILHVPDKNKKHPAIIIVPGFGGHNKQEHIDKLGVDLAKSGFVAISFDASGFAGSEGTPEEDYRMTNYLSDIESVYEHVKTFEFVDKERIGVWGHSIGGILAIIFAARNQQIKTICTVSVPNYLSTAISFLTLIEGWRRRGFYEKISTFDNKLIKVPYDFLLDSKKYRATDFVNKLHNRPILFIVGLKDISVDPSDTRNVYKQANEPKFWLEFPDVDHYYRKKRKLITEVNEKVIEFFKKYL